MDIVYKKVSEIHPYEKNPRKNSNTAEALVESIKAFGFKNPIIIDENDIIICGHARYKAAQMLGLEEVPTITASGLTKTQIKAFRIADNKTSELADWDAEKLSMELRELKAEDFSLDLTGFNEFEQVIYEDNAEPEKPDKQIYKAYEADADNQLRAFTVAIICEDESEQGVLADIFHEKKRLKRCYKASEIIEMRE
jgi:ParB-like chromosome segregation protein Spo0J